MHSFKEPDYFLNYEQMEGSDVQNGFVETHFF